MVFYSNGTLLLLCHKIHVPFQNSSFFYPLWLSVSAYVKMGQRVLFHNVRTKGQIWPRINPLFVNNILLYLKPGSPESFSWCSA